MSKIYTKGGDKGTTGIFGGTRVAKDDPRVEAYGTADELNAQIGLLRAMIAADDDRQQCLYQTQMHMMRAMSLLATPSAIRDKNPNLWEEDAVVGVEQEIDQILAQTKENGYFILPGGTLFSAQLQIARTVARRAERRLWTLHRIDPVPESILKWMNRLSDLFFVMARYEMQLQGWDEERWHAFAYKRKKSHE